MRARLDIANLVKERNEEGVMDLVYERFTKDEWESQFKKDFKTMKNKDEVEFYYIEEYPFKFKRNEPNFIEEIDDDSADIGPILIFFELKKFFKLRKQFLFKPVMHGMCKYIGDGEDYEANVEVPEKNHLAFSGTNIGTIKERVFREVLDPIKNSLGRQRFKFYAKLPQIIDPERIMEEFDELEERLALPRFLQPEHWEKNKSPAQDPDGVVKKNLESLAKAIDRINESENKDELIDNLQEILVLLDQFQPLAEAVAKNAENNPDIPEDSALFSENMEDATSGLADQINEIIEDLEKGSPLKEILRMMD